MNRALTRERGRSSPYIPASTPKSADVVLYSDLDGVLHHEAVLFHPKRGIYMSPSVAPKRTLFEWAPILANILEPYPDVKLVLSSTWCVRPGYADTLKRLPEELRRRYIGGTFHKRVHGADPWSRNTFLRTPRGVQVVADVRRRKPRHWLALDDDVEDWPAVALRNLLACDGATGLSSLEVQSALSEWLFAVHSGPGPRP
ncbi:HAD domain-containing protein [Hydrogenophaga sp.]|uniref:HAD domain-containing protein n=1 Tax=Hydrogenophaga sp. TaxID=1904254 RepID=UPI002723E6E5|nr:HAD domain-containing protein [Hydrogenophaga sp.]MDO9437726.1 HAD domain-containing protein [Hydrogenophaga sp.]